nr:adenylate/guanylate cyclase domain-containing protein [Alphaproteobacteria bacterium]
HPIAIGVGLNTGQCCVGNMGSSQRFDYSVLGDTVNLASRLEGQSKAYGVDIVIGEETRAQVPEMAALQLDYLRVKGKLEPVMVYGLIGDDELAGNEEFQALAERHDIMMTAYRTMQFDKAAATLAACRERSKPVYDLSALYRLYQIRLDHYAENPPPSGWDGVFVATTK